MVVLGPLTKSEKGLTDFGSIDIPDNDPPTILKDTCKAVVSNC